MDALKIQQKFRVWQQQFVVPKSLTNSDEFIALE